MKMGSRSGSLFAVLSDYTHTGRLENTEIEMDRVFFMSTRADGARPDEQTALYAPATVILLL